MNGFLLVDKPVGPTSFDVVRQVRRITRTKRVGHCGTLDPMASGVLIIAIGWATRLVEYLISSDKTYRATMRLGIATDTQDAQGTIIQSSDWHHVNKTAIEAALHEFCGDIGQQPPMYSALKKDGEPLYRLARKGLVVDRPVRQVHISKLVMEHIDLPEVTLLVKCSKGTYIRTLCHDLGQKLGCGAHMTSLNRLASGPFKLKSCIPLKDLEELSLQGQPLPLLSPADALADWPAISVDKTVHARLMHGIAPVVSDVSGGASKPGEKVKILFDNRLVATARYLPWDGTGQRRDFQLLKVFPNAEEGG